MKTGPKHAKHRALVMTFLSDKHLKGYSVAVEKQIEVMLAKWGCDNTEKSTTTRVNVQYDFSVLTLDIILLTAFGAGKQHLCQHILEKDNRESDELNFILKDVIIRTVVPG
jgi:cytochrome P450